MSPFRVMLIVSVEINRSVSTQQTWADGASLPTRPLEHSHCRAKPTRTVRVHCEHILMWSECTGRTRRSGRSVYTGNPTRTVRERYARRVKWSVWTRPSSGLRCMRGSHNSRSDDRCIAYERFRRTSPGYTPRPQVQLALSTQRSLSDLTLDQSKVRSDKVCVNTLNRVGKPGR